MAPTNRWTGADSAVGLQNESIIIATAPKAMSLPRC